MKRHKTRTPVVFSNNSITCALPSLVAFVAGLLLFGCATKNATVTIHIFGGRSMQEGEQNKMEAPLDVHDLIGDLDVSGGEASSLKSSDRGGGGGKSTAPATGVAPPGNTNAPPPSTNISKTSIFIESTKDGPNRTRLPSGRGAVAVLNGQWLGKIESVTVGGASFSNATDYTKLPNGSREHWRNGTHAKEFHGETISVKFKDGTTLTDVLDGSGGRLYRDNELNLK